MPNQDPQTFLTVHKNGKSRRTPGWSFDDLTLLKLIKDTATRLWSLNQLKNMISQED